MLSTTSPMPLAMEGVGSESSGLGQLVQCPHAGSMYQKITVLSKIS